MKIKLYIVFLATLGFNFAFAQNNYSVEKIDQLDITGFNLKINPTGEKLLYTTSNFNGLWLYSMSKKSALEISSNNGVGYEPLITDNYIFYKGKGAHNNIQRMEISSNEKISISVASKNQTPQAFYACEGNSKILEAKASEDLLSIILVYRDGREIKIAPMGKRNYLNVSLSPDETMILFRVSGLSSYITSLDGIILKEFKTAEFPVWLNNTDILFAEVSDNGHQYVKSDLYIASINGDQKFNLTASTNEIALYPCVSTNERKIAFNTPEGSVYLISLLKE